MGRETVNTWLDIDCSTIRLAQHLSGYHSWLWQFIRGDIWAVEQITYLTCPRATQRACYKTGLASRRLLLSCNHGAGNYVSASASAGSIDNISAGSFTDTTTTPCDGVRCRGLGGSRGGVQVSDGPLARKSRRHLAASQSVPDSQYRNIISLYIACLQATGDRNRALSVLSLSANVMYIEAQTKWPPLCMPYFQTQFF